MIRYFTVITVCCVLVCCGDDGGVVAVCGNGLVEAGEECDDGNPVSGDGCSSECTSENLTCPSDMVRVPADPDLGVDLMFCMDTYEASRSDATAQDMGTDTAVAISQPGVIPWHVNPVDAAAVAQFEAACAAAGKRLCGNEEWYAGCTGAERTVYVYGDTFDPLTCNCVDTFCEQYCLDHPEIDPCVTGDGCGYTYYSFHVMPTGSFPDCVNGPGAFDVNGNVWEVVPSDTDPRGFEVRGGAFNCAMPSQRLMCTFNAEWTSLNAGFRCCKDPEPR